MARLTQYNYVFAIGTFFAMLDAYNNGASKSSSYISK
jgi:sodium-dependent phosphate transporter